MTQTSRETVLVERHDAVLSITLNRPQVKNAIDLAMAQGVSAALDLLDEDPALSVGILSGAGSTFSSGLDLKAFLAGQRPRTSRGFGGIVERPPSKPLIAAVEGFALAGGFELVLSCDLVVASNEAVFGLPEVRRGLIASGGGLLRLPAQISRNVAAEWILTGRDVPADEAARVGLVNALVAPGLAYDTAFSLAEVISANGPLAVRASKQVLTESVDWTASERFARQQAIYEPVRSSRDAHEGALAFAERRMPRWRGQ